MRDETLDDYLERNNLFLCRKLTDEEILGLPWDSLAEVVIIKNEAKIKFAREIEERHGIK